MKEVSQLSTDASCILQVLALEKAMGPGRGLGNISFTLNRCQKLAVIGETGSGKSTLLRIIAGLLQPDAGSVMFEGKRVKGPDEQLIAGHLEIAYLSQQYELRNNYRVEELLEMASRVSEPDVKHLCEICRISHLLKRKTSELSGGEKQRIALERLLVTRPRLLILDEPFSNLDPLHKGALKSVLKDISERLHTTCMLASHEPFDTISWADEMLVLRDGMIMQQGSPLQLYHHPCDEYVAGLLGSYQLLTREAMMLWPDVEETLPADKRILIRPGEFRLSEDTAGSVPGTITAVTFMGSYYEVEVEIQGLTIKVLSLGCVQTPGDTVYVSFSAIEPHYL